MSLGLAASLIPKKEIIELTQSVMLLTASDKIEIEPVKIYKTTFKRATSIFDISPRKDVSLEIFALS